MRKEKPNIELNQNLNNFKKSIIKRINETAQNKNLKKIDTYRNKRSHLILNNDSNSYYTKTDKIFDNSYHNMYSQNSKEKYNNIFLENNSFLFKSKKTRNKIINFNQNINRDLLSHKNTIEAFNDKNIFLSSLNNKKNKKKFNKELINASHLSCDEEMSRKFYLNPNFNKIYLKCLKKKEPNNKSQLSSKNNEDVYYNSKTKSNINENKYYQNYNNGYLSTKDKSNLENTYGGNYSNSIKTSKNTSSPIITSFSYRNNNPKYTYKKVNICSSNNQRRKYVIDSYRNNNSNTNENNNQKIEESKLITKKRYGFKIYKKHHASKSQENIKENSSKYNHLFNKINIPILKKMNNYEYYKKNINFILKIQKWWKDMLFHMYIEKKIKFIQKYFRNYLNNKTSKIKIQLNYVYNINKILLIQKEWRKILKIKLIKQQEIITNNLLPKSIPFKIDNFDINENTESNFETKNDDNNKKFINIYLKKNVNKYQRKIIRSNTVSNFYKPDKNKLKTTKEINLSILSNKKETLSAFELQRRINNIKINNFERKYQINKNISFKIINYISQKNNNILYQPIKTNMLMYKQTKINKKEILNKAYISQNCHYISKLSINIQKINKYIILIQKNIKQYIKKNQSIIMPKIKNCYNSKIRKIINVLDYSSQNKIQNFSFKGNYFIANSNSNKDKISENDISNSKSEKTNSYNDKDKQKFSISFHNNFFSFENSGNKINNIESLQTLLLKDKIKNLFNKYFIFKYKLKIKEIVALVRNIKFIILIKKYIINKANSAMINIFKLHFKKEIKDKNIFDEDDIMNIINRKRLNKSKPSSNYLIINQKNTKSILNQKEYYINDEDGLANYILNYFYNEKKFTNINITLIKERLSKSPLIYRTQSNIKNYINDLHQDIIENKICHNCFCKFEENCDINCPCHTKGQPQINKQKGGISIYRQKINKIIKENKMNIKNVKNNEENENMNNFFKVNRVNIKNNENGICEYNNNISTVNRYDTDSIHSKSRSFSKE